MHCLRLYRSYPVRPVEAAFSMPWWYIMLSLKNWVLNVKTCTTICFGSAAVWFSAWANWAHSSSYTDSLANCQAPRSTLSLDSLSKSLYTNLPNLYHSIDPLDYRCDSSDSFKSSKDVFVAYIVQSSSMSRGRWPLYRPPHLLAGNPFFHLGVDDLPRLWDEYIIFTWLWLLFEAEPSLHFVSSNV